MTVDASMLQDGEIELIVTTMDPNGAQSTVNFGTILIMVLIFVLGWATRDALREARHGDTLWVTLLASGTVALLFDCAQIFTLHSDPRLELLLLAVPAALASGRVESARAD